MDYRSIAPPPQLATVQEEPERERLASQWTVTNKYFTVLEEKGMGGGKFGIFIDPTKCKGCAKCVDACGDHNALLMIRKNDDNMRWIRTSYRFYSSMPETPARL